MRRSTRSRPASCRPSIPAEVEGLPRRQEQSSCPSSVHRVAPGYLLDHSWLTGLGSNQGPFDYRSKALPTELPVIGPTGIYRRPLPLRARGDQQSSGGGNAPSPLCHTARASRELNPGPAPRTRTSWGRALVDLEGVEPSSKKRTDRISFTGLGRIP